MSDPLDLRAVEAEVAQYVADGGRWLLVTDRIPALLAALRETREALEPFATQRIFRPGEWVPALERAAAVLASVVDEEER
jgi:hypothetical protein